ncbi:J domain-containing protein [Geomonas sp.]|uniref:J domain-containing protein n=1 Tax=Geomonas sp. TaxID=2651584 RepID=UPI002B461368|nr:J domain-containing protein [Geomonas sp.]HJV36339.1 J domain-containing protein [Geomonas sp.]
MADQEFVDYYELLQLNPNADGETIERIFRHLAKKYHPDNTVTADSARFQSIMEAHRILSDPQVRASYDVKYQDYWNRRWKLASEATNHAGFGEDQLARERLLSLLYVQRRRSMARPGIGEVEVCKLLQLPPELVEFHLWYLKAKRWVERLDTGLLAITAEGVDQVEQNQIRLNPDHLLEAPGARRGGEADGADPQRIAAE